MPNTGSKKTFSYAVGAARSRVLDLGSRWPVAGSQVMVADDEEQEANGRHSRANGRWPAPSPQVPVSGLRIGRVLYIYTVVMAIW